MNPRLVVCLAVVIASVAHGDGSPVRLWSRMPKVDKCSPHYVGDPVLASTPGASTVRQTADVRLALPRGSFSFERRYVSDVYAQGQVTPTASPAECRGRVLDGAHAPFDSINVTHNLMSRVDTRCPSYTRVLTPDGDTRFFGPLPAVAAGSSAWVPRVAEALAEPSRLKLKKSTAGELSFEWYVEDGRVLSYHQIAGSVGYRLTSETDGEGRKAYDLVVGDPSTFLVPGAVGTGCVGKIEPLMVNFPETGVALELRFMTPQVGAVVGTQCLLARVDVVSAGVPSGRQTIVTYDYVLGTAGGLVTVEFRGATAVEDGGVPGWHEVWFESTGYSTITRYEELKPQVLRTVVDVRDSPGNAAFDNYQLKSVHDSSTGTSVDWSTEGASGGAMRRDFGAMSATGSNGGSACFSSGINSRQVALQAGGLTKLTTLSFFVGDAGLPDGGWSADIGHQFGPVPAQISDWCGSPGCAQGTTEFRYGSAPAGTDPGSPLICGGPSAPTVLWASKTRNDSFTVAPDAFDSQKGGVFRTNSVRLGATDPAGANALSVESRSFGFVGDVQLMTSVSEASVLNPAAQASTTYQRDSMGTVVGIVRTGYARSALSGAVDAQPKNLAVFYKKGQRPCSLLGELPTSARLTTIEGPCEVASVGATSCSSPNHLITELYYYDPNQTPPRALSETASTGFNWVQFPVCGGVTGAIPIGYEI